MGSTIEEKIEDILHTSFPQPGLKYHFLGALLDRASAISFSDSVLEQIIRKLQVPFLDVLENEVHVDWEDKRHFLIQMFEFMRMGEGGGKEHGLVEKIATHTYGLRLIAARYATEEFHFTGDWKFPLHCWSHAADDMERAAQVVNDPVQQASYYVHAAEANICSAELARQFLDEQTIPSAERRKYARHEMMSLHIAGEMYYQAMVHGPLKNADRLARRMYRMKHAAAWVKKNGELLDENFQLRMLSESARAATYVTLSSDNDRIAREYKEKARRALLRPKRNWHDIGHKSTMGKVRRDVLAVPAIMHYLDGELDLAAKGLRPLIGNNRLSPYLQSFTDLDYSLYCFCRGLQMGRG